jgi:hypothetical protein
MTWKEYWDVLVFYSCFLLTYVVHLEVSFAEISNRLTILDFELGI